MTRKILTLLLALVAGPAFALRLPITELGAFQLEFVAAQALQNFPGQPVPATVTYRQGRAYSVSSPGRLQQIEYLVAPGEWVGQGEPFAVLRGPEMHHFEMRYDSNRALLAGAKRRFDSNRALYENRAIDESRWLQISENYYAQQLEFEHLRHFFELVVEGDGDPDSLTLVAPLGGLIDYNAASAVVEEGDSIARFVPTDALALQAMLPNRLRAEVVALQAGSCALAVERVSGTSAGFFVQAWTAPLQPACELLPGQQVMATPLLRGDGMYLLPRSAVFQLDRQTLVLVRAGNALETVAVTPVISQGKDYVLRAGQDLTGREVLVSSVSALQGILLGLGGE